MHMDFADKLDLMDDDRDIQGFPLDEDNHPQDVGGPVSDLDEEIVCSQCGKVNTDNDLCECMRPVDYKDLLPPSAYEHIGFHLLG